MKTNLLKSIFISLILLVGATNAWANGGIGYKGVIFTKDGTTTGWYNIHNVTWDYVHNSYECRSGKSGVTDFNNADLGIVTSLKLHSFVVIGWTDNSDWVSGQLKYRTYLQSASAGNYNVYNVGNYETYCNAVDVLVTSGNNRVVGKNGTMDVTLVDNNTTPGKYYLQLQGMGRMRYCNGDFNTNNGSEVKASYTVPGFDKTTATQDFESTNVGSNLSKTISFTNHYGTKLTTSNCVLSGTNKSEFSVTSISETGVTVKFTPSSSGSKSATLTITDAHSKKCTITLSGTATLPTYTVTWDVDGTKTTEEYTVGATINKPKDPTKTGYTFAGWDSEVPATMPEENLTFTATWTVNSHTVTWKANGGNWDGNDADKIVSYDYGQTITKVADPTRTGYTFDGWHNGTSIVTPETTMPDDDLTYTAQWSPNSITITWNANGGSVSPESSNYTYNGDPVELPEPTRDGYTFLGWFTSANGGDKINDVGEDNKPTSDVEYFAQWQTKKYTVTYGVVGGKNGTIALGGETPAITNKNDKNCEHGDKLVFEANPTSGYQIQGWFSDDAGKNSLDNGTANTYTINSLTAQATVFVQFEEIPASTFIVTFNANGGEGIMNSQSFTENISQDLAANAFTRTGYTFTSWNTAADGTGDSYTDGLSVTLTTAGLTLYAQWTANQYTITLSQTGATEPGTASVEATFDAPMQAITQLPSKDGYAFMGYFAEEGGRGKQYYNQNGAIDDINWDIDSPEPTLYAHFEKAQIALTLNQDAFESNATGTVDATYTITPSHAHNVAVCWSLTYSNDRPINDNTPTIEDNVAKFSLNNLSAGSYKIVASLRIGNCEGDEVAQTFAQFTKVGNYTVTVRYTCGGETIAAATTNPGHPTTVNSVTAPQIGGYDFSTWVLGDGVTTTNDLKSETINYTVNHDAYLTATYEKKKLIFLDLSQLESKDSWETPHAYIYKEGGYWDNTKGAGSQAGGNFIAMGEMTKVPGEEYVWFYEYKNNAATFGNVVAFTSAKQEGFEYFHGCEAIYRSDFTSGTPVFVPVKQNAVKQNENGTSYYNEGFWVKYMGGTGYHLKVFNQNGDSINSSAFEYATANRVPMVATVELEAGQTYGFKIYRDNDKWYGNRGTMVYGTSTNWTFDETYWEDDVEHKMPNCGLTTTAAGDYTFTLDFTVKDNPGVMKVSVDYPVEAGDYRILYKDNTRNTYKPSQIIKKEDAEPIVGYFIRPGNDPKLKVQTAARVSNEGVTWTASNNEIFFKPNNNWKSDGARFAAWFNGDKWKDLNKNGDVYSCEIPSGATEVIFCRMDPQKATNNWSNKWNQTGHLKLTTNNLYTLNEGEWGNKLYLKPNSNWFQKDDNQKDPRFAAYFFNSGTDFAWVSMGNPVDGVYSCDIPATVYKNVIFCRMNGGNETNDWNNKYNQSSDLAVPTDGKTLYTVKDGTWDKGGGTWSVGEGTWNKITGSITDLSSSLTTKLSEINATADAVYTIYLSANGASIEKVEPYTGNYYIRVDAADGKWYDYKTNPDNLMTYSAFSERTELSQNEGNNVSEPFSHYKTAWCEAGSNVKFVIANDYSPCISDTLVQDEGNPLENIDEHGNLKANTYGPNNESSTDDLIYNANIRFMWDRSTNKVSRAYVAAATDPSRKFLVLKANKEIHDAGNKTLTDNEILFEDTQNWMYETTVKVQPDTRIKLYACYPDVDPKTAQYFRGKYANNDWSDENTSQLLGGSGNDWYDVRIIYDFKTNRLMTALISDFSIEEDLTIDADIMVVRSHHDDAQHITIANEGVELSGVKIVYGTLQFNRWILNNRGGADNHDVKSCTREENGHRVFDRTVTEQNHPALGLHEQKSLYERGLYFVSFPFDVHLSDVFGFGTYGTHWVISAYNGLRRAQRGYFMDNCVNDDCTNWDYIWEPDTFTMKANEGYLLSLDLDLMKYDNIDFWKNNRATVELYFPSMADLQTITRTDYTMDALSDEHKCKINLNVNGDNDIADRTIKDSYWRCIGVPSFADYLESAEWEAQDKDMPYLYEWNTVDNSLNVRSTNGFKFRSTFAYLVQNGNAIQWNAVNTQQPSPIMAKQQAAAATNYEWNISLHSQDEQVDQTYIRLTNNENVTHEFDFNQDLVKEFNYGRADIYTMIGYEPVAANSMPIENIATSVPLGIDVEKAGEYTIAMLEGTTSVGVTLVDIETGKRTNLAAGMEYTVYLAKGKHNERFMIEISPVNNAPTDIDQINGGSMHHEGVQKYIIDGRLYLKKDGILYDAQGHVVR